MTNQSLITTLSISNMNSRIEIHAEYIDASHMAGGKEKESSLYL